MAVLEAASIHLDPETVLLALFTVLLVMWLSDLRKGRGMPPGPLNWPIIGNMVQVAMKDSDEFLDYLSQMGRKYGKKGLFRLKLGEMNMVFICNFKTLKEAFVKQSGCFSSRPHMATFANMFKPEAPGIVMGNGLPWQTLRRFAITALRDMGVGKKSLEEKIQMEAAALQEEYAKNVDKLYDPSYVTQRAVANIITHIVFNERYDYSSETLTAITDNIKKILSSLLFVGLKDMFKILKVLPDSNADKRIVEGRGEMLKLCEKQIKRHQETFNPYEIRDLIDMFIEKRNESGERTKYFTDGVMGQLTIELLGAGSETTGTTLSWAWLYMSMYPEIQEKCFKEINEVLGNRFVTMADRPHLPYTDAVIAELQRMTTIAPLGVAHTAEHDTTLNGYRIPKGTIVMPMLHHIHMDSKENENPLKFKPERYLDENGKCNRLENLIPFGIGPRTCAGEPLARMELFIFVTSMIQRFKFSKPPPPNKIDLNSTLGFTLSPKPQEIMLSVR